MSPPTTGWRPSSYVEARQDAWDAMFAAATGAAYPVDRVEEIISVVTTNRAK